MIHLTKSTFYKEQKTKDRLCDFIQDAEILSMSTKCLEFEKTFAEWQDRKHALLFNSGSSANLALLQAIKNLKIFDSFVQVGYTGITWATNVMPIIQMGYDPIAIDIDIETLNINIDSLYRRQLDVLFVTNILGFIPDMEAVLNYCDNNNVILIEDCCESMGSIDKHGIRAGNYGLASTFSLYVAHHISSIEGGIICTDDDDLYEMLLMVRAHGWDRNLCKDKQTELRLKHNVDDFYAKYTFYNLGYNLRPTEITGFLALEQMNYIGEIIIKRHDQFMMLNDMVKLNNDLIPIDTKLLHRVSAFGMPVICRTKQLRDEYLQKFENAGIETRPIISGNIQYHPFYEYPKHELPNVDFIHDNGFYVSNSPELTDKELQIIKDCITGK